jgi:hexulose-6-phosphate isomerase
MQNISRRTFLAASAVGAAALATKPAAAGEFTGRIKKAVKYGMISGDMPAVEKFKMIKDLGYDGVEPGVGNDKEAAELLEASEKTGVPIHGVVNGSVSNIPRAIDRAVMYGSSSVLLVAGRVNEKMPYADNYEQTQQTIREAIPYAAEKKIMLLVENVWNNFLFSPLEMARYLDELESEWVGCYFDVGNIVRIGYPEHWIPVLGERIKKLDIKEYSTKKQNDEGLWKGFDVKIGEGSIDWAAVRRELTAINYEGWATAEVGGGGRDRLEDIAKRMDNVLDI